MAEIQNNVRSLLECTATGTLLPSWLVGVQDGVATLKDSLKASYKNKHTVSI
jgi:hypothetical protein